MSQVCEICAKKKSTGFNVSFSHRRTKRVWKPNLIKAKILVEGKPVKTRICAKCLKSLDK